ncbi:MAG: hypothetical protein ABC360_03735 [Acetomicrobium sp.]
MLKVYKSSARPSEVSSQALGIFVFEGKIEESLKELEGLGKRVKSRRNMSTLPARRKVCSKSLFPKARYPGFFLRDWDKIEGEDRRLQGCCCNCNEGRFRITCRRTVSLLSKN